LWINVTKDMSRGSTYSLNIDAGVVTDMCGTNPNTAITSGITWTIDGGATASSTPPPAGSSLAETGIKAQYDRPVQKGTGSVEIKNSTGSVVGSIPATSPAVSVKEG
jgi:hypothetical protein